MRVPSQTINELMVKLAETRTALTVGPFSKAKRKLCIDNCDWIKSLLLAIEEFEEGQ